MSYDNWKCGGSDPGYDPMDPRDEPEPDEELEGWTSLQDELYNERFDDLLTGSMEAES